MTIYPVPLKFSRAGRKKVATVIPLNENLYLMKIFCRILPNLRLWHCNNFFIDLLVFSHFLLLLHAFHCYSIKRVNANAKFLSQSICLCQNILIHEAYENLRRSIPFFWVHSKGYKMQCSEIFTTLRVQVRNHWRPQWVLYRPWETLQHTAQRTRKNAASTYVVFET